MRTWPLLGIVHILFAASAVARTNIQDNRRAPDHVRFYLMQSGGGLGGDLEETVVFYADGPGLSGPWFVDRSRTETNCLARGGPQNPCAKTFVSESIDGRSCPALESAMMRLGAVRKLEQGSAHDLVNDAPLLSLVAIRDGMIATDRLAEYEGPLVDWWQSAQQQLKSCWRVRGRG